MGKFLLADIKDFENVSSTEYAVRFLAECDVEHELPLQLAQAIDEFRGKYAEAHPDAPLQEVQDLTDIVQMIETLKAKRKRLKHQADKIANDLTIAELMNMLEEHMSQIYYSITFSDIHRGMIWDEILEQLKIPYPEELKSLARVSLQESIKSLTVLTEFLHDLNEIPTETRPMESIRYMITMSVFVSLLLYILKLHPAYLFLLVIILGNAIVLSQLPIFLIQNWDVISKALDQHQLQKPKQPKYLEPHIAIRDLIDQSKAFNSKLPLWEKPEADTFTKILKTRRQLELEWMEIDPKFCKRSNSSVPATMDATTIKFVALMKQF